MTTTYNRERRPVRKIPTREQLDAAARRQAQYETDVAGENDYELEEDESYYQTRPHTSVRRYQQIPDIAAHQGSIKVVEHYHQQPLRAHRQQLPPPRQREIYTDEVETPI